MSSKTCPQCGGALSCDANEKYACWCASYPAIMPLEGEAECLCRKCLAVAIGDRIEHMIASHSRKQMLEYAAQYRGNDNFIEHIDYTIEDGLYVFSAWYHLKRASCCGSGCRNCPYRPIVSS